MSDKKSEDFIINEFTSGLFEGKLEANFIDTILETGKPYIQVKVMPFFEDSDEYPLTYVPSKFFTLSLKEGDSVRVYFHEGDMRLPILYDTERDFLFATKFSEDKDELFEEYDALEDGDLIEFPEADKTFSYKFYDEDHFILFSDTKQIIHRPDCVIMICDNGLYLYNEVNGILTEEMNVELSTFKMLFNKSIEFFDDADDPTLSFLLNKDSNSASFKAGDNELTLDGKGKKILITDGKNKMTFNGTTGEYTLELGSQGGTIKDTTSKIKISSDGVEIDSNLEVKINGLAGLTLESLAGIEMKSMIGNLKDVISALWDAIDLVNNNVGYLNTSLSGIQYAGPGALIDTHQAIFMPLDAVTKTLLQLKKATSYNFFFGG